MADDLLNWRHGENAPYVKLTNSQAGEIIRRSVAGERNVALAAEFGVSAAAISKLTRGERWKRLGGTHRSESRLVGTGNHAAKLTEADVRAIRIAHASGSSFRRLAAQFGVTVSPILGIVQGRTWKHVK